MSFADFDLHVGFDVSEYVQELVKSGKLLVHHDQHTVGAKIAKALNPESDPNDHTVEFYRNCLQGIFMVKKGVTLDDVKSGRAVANLTSLMCQCDSCGTSLKASFSQTGLYISGKTSECCVDKKFKVTLSFPTGRVLICDAPPAYQLTESEFESSWIPVHSINYFKGIRDTTINFASLNMGHFFVGNSCPAVRRNAEGQIVLRPDESGGGRILGRICTDLWWATLVDYDSMAHVLASLPGTEDLDIGEVLKQYEHVNVEPGVYEFTYSMDIVGDSAVRRITGTRVGDCM